MEGTTSNADNVRRNIVKRDISRLLLLLRLLISHTGSSETPEILKEAETAWCSQSSPNFA
jgi:hypothetical protein